VLLFPRRKREGVRTVVKKHNGRANEREENRTNPLKE
jgi:hypothetical protein